MKYLETNHEKNSAKITTLIIVIFVLLCFVVGQDYQELPEEYGVAINFGDANLVSDNIQPDNSENVQDTESEPEESQEVVEEETAEDEVAEEIVEEETAQEIAEEEKQAEEALAEEKAEAEAVEAAEEEAAKEAEAEAAAEKLLAQEEEEALKIKTEKEVQEAKEAKEAKEVKEKLEKKEREAKEAKDAKEKADKAAAAKVAAVAKAKADKAAKDAKAKAAADAKAKAQKAASDKAAAAKAAAAKAAAAKAASDKAAAAKASAANNNQGGGETVSFALIENSPIYPGCESGNNVARKKCMNDKIKQFLNNNFNKILASDIGLNGIQKINIRFTINENGTIVGIRAKAADAKLEAEAKRVVKLLPKMKPGEQQGRPASVSFNLPLSIKID